MNKDRSLLFGFLGITGFALMVRLLAARHGYPACGDSLHFINNGYQLAQGDWVALSAYWSQGQILFAALAFRVGWDPQVTLQAVTIVGGTALVAALAALTYQLCGRPSSGACAGLLAAVNPWLVNLSTTGYSEMPMLGAWSWGAYLLLWAETASRKRLALFLSAVCFGLGMYFRLLDCLILLGGLLIAVPFVTPVASLTLACRRMVALLLLIAVIVSPLSIHSQLFFQSWFPSQKAYTIVQGDQAYDSKIMYGTVAKPWKERTDYLEQNGVVAYLWKYRSDTIHRATRNMANIVRCVADKMFVNSLRLGPSAFLLLLTCLTVATLRLNGYKLLLPPLVPMTLHVSALSLYFVFERYIATEIALTSVMFGLGFASTIMMVSRAGRALVISSLGLYVAITLPASVQAFEKEFQAYRYHHLRQVALEFSSIWRPGDRFMSQESMVLAQSMGIYEWKVYEEAICANLDDVTRYCREKGVRYLFASDCSRAHWPLAELARNPGSRPVEWTPRQTWHFAADPATGFPEETIVLFEWTGRNHP